MTEQDTTTSRDPRADQTIELTGFELLSLLSLGDDASARKTRESLRLPEVPEGSPLLGAGLSSLIVRKMATVDDAGVLTPQGPVLALAAVLNRATEWIEAAGVSGETNHVALLVKSPDGAAMIEPKPYGIWQALPVPADDRLIDVASRYVRATYQDITTLPFAGSIKVIAQAGGDRAAAVRIGEDKAWEISSGPVERLPKPVPVEADPTFTVLAKALA
ncbi:hypothetical protein ACFO6V_15975 [Promicromonospora alba]|uniref:Type III secretion system (T3SS) SseB-like protein n=1 Tax=Promicromonospora alba TaxID=1616110 RepID=A0ABV9HJJ8_9MICO